MTRIDRCSNCLSLVQLVAAEICPHYGRPSPDIWAEAAVEAAKQGDFEYALTLLRAWHGESAA